MVAATGVDMTVIKRNGAAKGRKVMLVREDLRTIQKQNQRAQIPGDLSLETKLNHAIFVCLTHNFLLLFEQRNLGRPGSGMLRRSKMPVASPRPSASLRDET